VKRIFQRKDSSFLPGGFGATALLFRMRVGARELQRSVYRFGATIGEKNTIEAGPISKLSRERPLICIVKEIRKVNGTARFPPDHAHQSRMRMSERIDCDAPKKIEILAPIRIVHPASTAAREYDGRTFVRVHQMPRFVRANPDRRDGFSRCHFVLSHS
jgi:hypothetical protein